MTGQFKTTPAPLGAVTWRLGCRVVKILCSVEDSGRVTGYQKEGSERTFRRCINPDAQKQQTSPA